MTGTASLLQSTGVAGYLRGRGLLRSGEHAEVRALGGGVSNTVFAVHTSDRRLVVKQALPQLRVADPWAADPARSIQEGRALRLMHDLTPDDVPQCLDLDVDRNVVVVEHSPPGWVDWKSRLLLGEAAVSVAGRLGAVLATWHRLAPGDLGLLGDRTAFHELRVDPFYRTVMARRPDLARAVELPLQRMLRTRACLVHGDFSPKNVLVGAEGQWVIDMEVVHLGDPAFDVAYLLTHLMLKSIHRPAARPAYRGCAQAFIDEYTGGFEGAPAFDHVAAHVGCLLLARVVGKSPAEYLDESGRAEAVRTGERLVADPATDIDQLWGTLAEATSG